MNNIISNQESLPTTLLSRNYVGGCFWTIVGFIITQTLLSMNIFSSLQRPAHYSDWAVQTSFFISGAFIVSSGLQFVRIILDACGSGLGESKGPFITSLLVNIIATFSTVTAASGKWGGLCLDGFGVETNAETWPEYLVTVPLLTYIMVSVDVKPKYDKTDVAIVVFMTIPVVCGSLLQVFPYFHVACCLYFLAWLSFLVSLFIIWRTCFNTAADPVIVGDENEIKYQYLQMIVERKRTLATVLLLLFPVFPISHTLAVLKIFGPDEVFAALITFSAGSKIMFAALCCDSHMEVSHPSLNQLAAEVQSHSARRAFLRYVFHEVRVPLNSISLGVQLLEDSDNLDDNEHESVMMMREACTFMGESLNDIMAIQKIEEGALQLIMKPFSLVDLLGLCLEPFTDLAASKHIEIVTMVAEDTPKFVVGDKYRLKHALANIMSNAIKFTKVSSKVAITAEASRPFMRLKSALQPANPPTSEEPTPNNVTPEKDTFVEVRHFVFRIADQGKGIPANKVASIFTPFVAKQKSSIEGALQQGRGIGIGLAITREIVRMHGGSISCSSVLDVGTTFTIAMDLEVAEKAQEFIDQVSRLAGQRMGALSAAVAESQRGQHETLFAEQPEDSEKDKDPNSMWIDVKGGEDAEAEAANALAGASPVVEPTETTGLRQRNTKASTTGSATVAVPSAAEPMLVSAPAVAPALTPTAPPTAAPVVVVPAPVPKKKNNASYNFRMLCVDDVQSNRKLLAMLLKKKGIDPQMAEDGVIAFDMVSSQHPDAFEVIFMDNTMPNMTGIECTKKLRAHGYSNIIIGLTGNSMEEELVEFANMGADLVLTKPLKPAALDLLLEHFADFGVKSQTGKNLFVDGEKLMWVPKRRGARSRSPSAKRKVEE